MGLLDNLLLLGIVGAGAAYVTNFKGFKDWVFNALIGHGDPTQMPAVCYTNRPNDPLYNPNPNGRPCSHPECWKYYGVGFHCD